MIGQPPQWLETLIRNYLGAANPKEIARDVVRLSDAFTTGRGDLLPRYLDEPKLLRAYISLFLPINAAKVLHVLNEAQNLDAIPSRGALRLLDVGCGPGTASLAASIFFSEREKNRRLEITGIDRSAPAVDVASRLFRHTGNERHHFHGEAGVLSAGRFDRFFAGKKFDIIIASNVINEINDPKVALKFCRTLIDEHLGKEGLLLVIDPALRETARPLMKLRDELLAACPDIHICAPCVHQHPCPMLALNRRDWCHFYVEWKRPEIVRQLDALTGLDHRHIKMAYLIMCHQEILRCAQDDGPGVARVVSSPLISKGKRELVLCGPDGRLAKAMRQDKDATDFNRDFDVAKRGDVVEASSFGRIGKGDRFNIRRPWAAPGLSLK